jgi:tetratricopeptide (TPR) repeat protein
VGVVEAGLSRHPDSEWLHQARALALWRWHRLGPALAAAEEALRLDARSAGAHNVRSLVLLAMRRVPEARAAAERALAIAPDVAVYHAQLGDAWLRESPAVAEGHYRASLELDPEKPLTLNNLGVALRRQGRFEEAAQAFKGALALDPSLALAKVNLFSVSNPMMGRRWLAWPAVPLCIALPLVVGRYGLTGPGAWGSWAVIGANVLYVLGLVWLSESGRRTQASERPGIHAVRSRIEADLDAGRITLGRGAGCLGLALAAFGGLSIAACLSVEVMVLLGRGPFVGSRVGWSIVLLVLAGGGALLLVEGMKVRRQAAGRPPV